MPGQPSIPDFPSIVTAAEMRGLEEEAIAAGISEESLMDDAGAGMARFVRRIFPKLATAVVFAGKGHNAGDAFVLAGHLLDAGWRVNVRLAWPREELRPLAAAKLEAIQSRVKFQPLDSSDIPSGRLLLLDGILGIGAGGELRGPAADAVRAVNALRAKSGAHTLAIDLPSGLGSSTPVLADVTMTLGWPKEELFADEAAACTGRLIHVPLAKLSAPGDTADRDRLVTAPSLRTALPERPLFSKHKGESGRVGIVAGSLGLTGAARLTSTAASLMGGGLVTLFCPHSIYPILAAACPPEVMVRPVSSCLEVRDFQLDAIGIGPGMGSAPLPYLTELLFHDPRPVIIDADALNALASGPWLANGTAAFAGPRLLTPHPGELARLIKAWKPDWGTAPRREQAKAFTDAFPVTLLAKSARSLVVEKGLPAAWNSTGHPLMARGGMGDVLTGFLTTFAAQGMPLHQAAALGSWVLGRGAELYHRATGFTEPGTASEVMAFAAGHAMAELRL
ncbi:MAG: Bifunctional NAD(P)H-hydrate repair enzyme [Verrucomicrobiales bacterium]|nr:Bifunctional NAD(P)H-hydrate repair enzyme [Verrucomicrobiales bacterium]